MTIPGFTCTTCGSPDLIALRPGTEPEVAPGLFTVDRGAPSAVWCAGCWPWRATRAGCAVAGECLAGHDTGRQAWAERAAAGAPEMSDCLFSEAPIAPTSRARASQTNGLVGTSLVNAVLPAITALPQALFVRRNVGAARTPDGRVVRFNRKGMADIGGMIAGIAAEIECKAGKGRLTNDQRLWRDAVIAAGGIYIVARDPDQVVAALQDRRSVLE